MMQVMIPILIAQLQLVINNHNTHSKVFNQRKEKEKIIDIMIF